MKPRIEKLLIVGAGGVASYMMMPLQKAFDIKELIIMDGDVLEERNIDRQLFCPTDIGINKAEALMLSSTLPGVQGLASRKYLTQASDITEPYDVILCCVDNHKARRLCLEVADLRGIPVILSGNEYFDSQAMLYLPEWKNSESDPRIKFPEILTDNSGDPTSCQGEEQEIHPQLAIANFSAASLALDLLWRLLVLAPEAQAVPWLSEIHKTRNNYEFSKTMYYEQEAI